MKICLSLLVLSLAIYLTGCAKKEVQPTYELSDVEQMLKDHPELSEAPPAEFRVPGEKYD
ncbi:hypothetical protein Poly21_55180 [Allorhodopirellula heiligendammensis]|uniref:Secreted protein n=2 Tax=Allorhodopirellula heiligendammensis TaxID=2714739 RepID=A0A5C6BCE5_9BACT|nr:hypothetical protein Poly21_55180 [Allorhodopirellula heiligendammensis]